MNIAEPLEEATQGGVKLGHDRYDAPEEGWTSVRPVADFHRTEELRTEEHVATCEETAWVGRAMTAGRMGAWQWNLQTQELRWNDGMELLHGFAPGQFPGTWEAAQGRIHREDRTEIWAALAETVESGRAYQRRYRVTWPDGSLHWLESRGQLLRDAAGTPARLVGGTWEIPEQSRVEALTQFLADAAAALAPLGDPEQTLQQVLRLAVPRFADWCFVELRMADGSLRASAMSHPDAAWAQRADQLAVQLDPHSARGSLHLFEAAADADRTDGAPASAPSHDVSHELPAHSAEERRDDAPRPDADRWRSACCAPLHAEGRNYGVLTFVTADSDRLFTAEDLAALEDFAGRAAISLRNARTVQSLRQAEQRKDEFLATLAHELRSPLAPIRNAVDVLGLPSPSILEMNWAREVISRQVRQMSHLVDDLLDVSRIGSGKLRPRYEAVTLSTLLGLALETSSPLIEQRGHELTVSAPPHPVVFEADLTRLGQVLANLLNNAAKYTDPGGRIELIVEPGDDQVVFRVRDTGIGIPPQLLPHIFEMFHQVDRSVERSQGGLGIGLALSKRLVEMHGGTLICHSGGAGQGSEFVVSLPAHPTPRRLASPPPGAEPASEAAHSRRILVVDDQPDSAEMLAVMLRMLGHDVQTAHDGPTALERADSFQPQAALLDIGLPGMDGYEVGRRLRSQYPMMQLVALTGYGDDEARRLSQAAGFNTHLVKPVGVDSLESLLGAGAA